MNKREQIKFVRELSKNVVDDIVASVRAGKTPETWDGRELRQLLCDNFRVEAMDVAMAPERWREYRNAVITNDL